MFAMTTVNLAWYKTLVHNISPFSERQTNDKIQLTIQFPRNCDRTRSVPYSNTIYEEQAYYSNTFHCHWG